MRKSIMSILLVFSLIFSSYAVAFAKEDKDPKFKVEFKEKKDGPKLKDPKEIEARMNMISEGMHQAFSKNGNPADVEEYLKSQGLEIIPVTQELSANSSNDQVYYYMPVVAYDSPTGQYVIEAAWDWKKNSSGLYYWGFDLPAIVGNVGGMDGAGLWVGTPTNITFKKFTMTTWDKDLGHRFDYTTPWDWNQYGVTFKAQDTCWLEGSAYDYSWDSGEVQAWCSVSGSVNTYLKTSLAHDWSSTGLSSCSISSTGISFVFNNSTNSWQGASQPTTWKK